MPAVPFLDLVPSQMVFEPSQALLLVPLLLKKYLCRMMETSSRFLQTEVS